MQFELPFTGNSLPAIMQNITSSSTPKPLPKCYSKSLRQLTKNLLSQQPSKRPSAESVLSAYKCFSALPSSEDDTLNCQGIEIDSQELRKSSESVHEPLLGKSPQTVYTRPSSLHHRLNQELLRSNKSGQETHPKMKTWDECLKEAEANVHTSVTKGLLPNRRSHQAAINYRRYLHRR